MVRERVDWIRCLARPYGASARCRARRARRARALRCAMLVWRSSRRRVRRRRDAAHRRGNRHEGLFGQRRRGRVPSWAASSVPRATRSPRRPCHRFAQEVLHLGGRGAGRLGQLAHLVSDNAEAAPVHAGSRRLDRGVERQQVRPLGDVLDELHRAADPRAHAQESSITPAAVRPCSARLLHRPRQLVDCRDATVTAACASATSCAPLARSPSYPPARAWHSAWSLRRRAARPPAAASWLRSAGSCRASGRSRRPFGRRSPSNRGRPLRIHRHTARGDERGARSRRLVASRFGEGLRQRRRSNPIILDSGGGDRAGLLRPTGDHGWQANFSRSSAPHALSAASSARLSTLERDACQPR